LVAHRDDREVLFLVERDNSRENEVIFFVLESLGLPCYSVDEVDVLLKGVQVALALAQRSQTVQEEPLRIADQLEYLQSL